MTEREWEKFFELLEKIISSPKPSWQERAEEIRSQAEANVATDALEEFIGLFPAEG